MRNALILASLALAVPLAGCGSEKAGETPAAAGRAETDGTIASTLADAANLTTVSSAIGDAGLTGVFDGPGSYTLLAPDDEAFAKLGGGAQGLTTPERRAELVAVLRGHILPGHLSTEAIGKAIDAKKGPVTITTLGESTVEFARSGDGFTVTGADGSVARIAGQPMVASNGVVLPLDGLIKKPEPAAAAAQ